MTHDTRRLHPTLRLVLGLLVVVTLVCFALALWGHWPWLTVEHHRLDPFCRYLIWIGDGSALLWFVWFGVRHCLLGRPLPARMAADNEFNYMIVSLFGALSIDLAITGYALHSNAEGMTRSHQVPGEIVSARVTDNRHKADVTYRFVDKQGNVQTSAQRLDLRLQQPHRRDAILNNAFPDAVMVNYDERWPQRCWLVQATYTFEEQIFAMALACLTLQAICTFASVLIGELPTSAGVIPLYKMIPLWGMMVPFCFGALALFLEGSR